MKITVCEIESCLGHSLLNPYTRQKFRVRKVPPTLHMHTKFCLHQKVNTLNFTRLRVTLVTYYLPSPKFKVVSFYPSIKGKTWEIHRQHGIRRKFLSTTLSTSKIYHRKKLSYGSFRKSIPLQILSGFEKDYVYSIVNTSWKSDSGCVWFVEVSRVRSSYTIPPKGYSGFGVKPEFFEGYVTNDRSSS